MSLTTYRLLRSDIGRAVHDMVDKRLIVLCNFIVSFKLLPTGGLPSSTQHRVR